MNKLIAFIGWSVCAVCLTVSGCEKESQAPTTTKIVKKIVQEEAGAVKPVETQKPVDGASPAAPAPEKEIASLPKEEVAPPVWIYNPEGKIDPFEPAMIAAEEAAAGKKKHSRPLTPLEKFDVGQLKLSGVIQAPSGNRALVEEASGKGYIVGQGAYIGIYSGRIVQIFNDRIVIEEELEDDQGKTYVRQREMKLQKPPGEE